MSKAQSLDKTYLFEKMPVPKAAMNLALPTVLGQLILVVYNMADTYFVSQTGDPSQVAALTLCFPIYLTLIALGNLFGIGANSLIARSLGAKNYDMARRSATWSVFSGVVITAVLMILLSLVKIPLLKMMGGSGVSLNYAVAYLRWAVVIGGTPTVLQLLLAHCVRAIGEARKASVSMMACGILNVVLDPIFIFTFHMGIAGAAIATGLSNTIAAAYLVFIVYKEAGSNHIAPSPKYYRPFVKYGGEILLLGLPAALMTILACIANLIIVRIISEYGDTVIAAFGVMQKIGSIVIQLSVGFTQGIMPLVGYNYAARDVRRVNATNRFTIITLMVFTAVFVSLVEFFAAGIVRLFFNEPEVVAIGAGFLHRWILCTPFLCLVFMLTSILQAMGKWKQSLFLSIFRQAIIYIPLLFVLHRFLGLYGVFFAQPISETVTFVIALFLYASVMKRVKKEIGETPEPPDDNILAQAED